VSDSERPMLESPLPSDEWQWPRVHWHAFAVTPDSATPSNDRIGYRHRPPEAVLRSPWAVASWIDDQTRQHVSHREVWAAHGGEWVAIGDEEDLDHLRRENYGIAARGDSIHTDIYADLVRHELVVEAVTDEQCRHGCAAGTAD